MIITAEEFLIKNNDKDFRLSKSGLNVSDMMIEFAQYHCTQQLHEILNNIELVTDKDVTTEGLVVKVTVDTKSIVNAYPLENIK